MPAGSWSCPGPSQNPSRIPDPTFLPTAAAASSLGALLINWNLGCCAYRLEGVSFLETGSSMKNDLWNKVLKGSREEGMQSPESTEPQVLSSSERRKEKSWNRGRMLLGNGKEEVGEFSTSWLLVSWGQWEALLVWYLLSGLTSFECLSLAWTSVLSKVDFWGLIGTLHWSLAASSECSHLVD